MKNLTKFLNVVSVILAVFALVCFVDAMMLQGEQRVLLDLNYFLGAIVIVCCRIALYVNKQI